MGPLLTFYLSCARVRDATVMAMAAKRLRLVNEQVSESKRTLFLNSTHTSWHVTLQFARGVNAPVLYTLTFIETAGLMEAAATRQQGTCSGAHGDLVQYFMTTVGSHK